MPISRDHHSVRTYEVANDVLESRLRSDSKAVVRGKSLAEIARELHDWRVAQVERRSGGCIRIDKPDTADEK
jgi:hypothetical protein